MAPLCPSRGRASGASARQAAPPEAPGSRPHALCPARPRRFAETAQSLAGRLRILLWTETPRGARLAGPARGRAFDPRRRRGARQAGSDIVRLPTLTEIKIRLEHAALAFDAWVNASLYDSGRSDRRGLRALPARHEPLRGARLEARRPRPDERGRDHRDRRRGADAGAGAAGLPAHQRELAEAAGPRRHLPRPLRHRGRAARHQARRLAQARRVSRHHDQGAGLHRGPALLRALGHRPDRHPAGAGQQLAGRRRHPGRLVDHPAARQEPVPDERALARAQGQRGVPGAVAREPPDQERDPEALSRPRLHGRRHLRRGGGGGLLFRQAAQGHQPRRGRHAGRPVQGADQVRPARQPAGGPRPRGRRAAQHGRGRLRHRRPDPDGPAQPGDAGDPHPRHHRRLLPRLGLRRDQGHGGCRASCAATAC